MSQQRKSTVNKEFHQPKAVSALEKQKIKVTKVNINKADALLEVNSFINARCN